MFWYIVGTPCQIRGSLIMHKSHHVIGMQTFLQNFTVAQLILNYSFICQNRFNRVTPF